MRTLLVAGATGYLGGFVIREARRRGLRVRALVRPGKVVEEADEVFEGEATRAESLDGLCDGVDFVFSSLGITRQTDRVSYMDVDYGANLNVLRQAEACGVQRFGFVSVPHPERFAGNPLMDARERFVAELKASPVPSTVVRATGFFSDMEEFLDMARRGSVYIFDDRTRMNPIHGADLAEVVLDALEQGESETIAGGPDVLTQRQIAELVFAALDEPARVRVVPGWLATLAIGVLGVFSSRLHTIATFMRAGALEDMIGAPHGSHHLADHYRSLVAEGS